MCFCWIMLFQTISSMRPPLCFGQSCMPSLQRDSAHSDCSETCRVWINKTYYLMYLCVTLLRAETFFFITVSLFLAQPDKCFLNGWVNLHSSGSLFSYSNSTVVANTRSLIKKKATIVKINNGWYFGVGWNMPIVSVHVSFTSSVLKTADLDGEYFRRLENRQREADGTEE